MLYNPTIGLINYVLKPIIGTPAWLTDVDLAVPALVVVDTWQWLPFMFLVLRAAVLSTSVEIEEAAIVDGASRLQLFRRILLPQLYPAIAIVLLIRSIDVLKVFDVIYVMTGGGPGRLTETLGIYIYRTAFEEFNLGYAAALSYVQLALVLVLGLGFVIRLQRRQEDAG
jgi:multiple sugar transport system permease protein